ncbi:hypothetical protein MH215_12305 [Paenibacillus sp. ACRSA]|uniref:hypothetical protein n=1 Tax=Paenibacillus sp. ACRSA TaxID=2918211 RepID=UPI001EF6EC80|nr:hypothetical protein [Paenibacillus sp. ACRSA]MCG7377778.1 hypothetical protein [Paenibacillus sp. ACRSA]
MMKKKIASAFVILSVLELIVLIFIGRSIIHTIIQPDTFTGIISLPLAACFLSLWMFFSKQKLEEPIVAMQICFITACLTFGPLVCLWLVTSG